MALTNKRKLHFWGEHGSEGRIVVPVLVQVRNVVAIGATRCSSVSACKTAKGKVYLWGFAYGHNFTKPSPIRFRTLAEVFESLDSPVTIEPLKFAQDQQIITEKLKLNLDDKVNTDQFRV